MLDTRVNRHILRERRTSSSSNSTSMDIQDFGDPKQHFIEHGFGFPRVAVTAVWPRMNFDTLTEVPNSVRNEKKLYYPYHSPEIGWYWAEEHTIRQWFKA